MNSISNSDVLCGKGPQLLKHPGNIHYRNYVKAQLHDYCNATKLGKSEIMQKVLQEVNKNGSFLKKNSDTNEWEQLDCKKALDKIAASFRTFKRDAKNNNEDLQAASTMVAISQSADYPSMDDRIQDSSDDRIQDFIDDSCDHYCDDPLAHLLSSDDITSSDSNVPLKFRRTLFYDDEAVDPSDWEELKGRLLPKDNIFHIVSIYAFHAYQINKLTMVSSRSNAYQCVYKCASCSSPIIAWQVMVQKLRQGDDNSLWQVIVSKFAHKNMNKIQFWICLEIR